MDKQAAIFALLLGVGIFLLVAAPTLVELFFMPARLEIIKMGIQASLTPTVAP